MKYNTTFSTAVNWLHNDFVMCNNLPSVDPSIFENCRFPLYYYEDEEGNEYESEEDAPEGVEVWENETEIYQYFITSCTASDVEFLEAHFTGLLFTYSDLLDVFVLCVSHWGTCWDYVTSTTDLECAECKEGERK